MKKIVLILSAVFLLAVGTGQLRAQMSAVPANQTELHIGRNVQTPHSFTIA